MIDSRAREALRGLQNFAGTLLGKRLGLTPNQITIAGVVLTAVGSWRIVEGAFLSAGLIITAAGVIDFCDGAVAKVTGRASTFGAFVDSVADRFSDAIMLSAILWFYASERSTMYAALALAALAGAQVTSYIRAKAESLGYDSKVGIMERAERIILIASGLILGILGPLLWILVAGAVITIVQRLVHVTRQARAGEQR